MSVWDPINLAQLKTMNTWIKELEIKVDDKVIKLRQERFLIVQQTRKLDLRNTIGNFEMSLLPRVLFNNKSCLLTLIEEIPTIEGIVPDENERGEASITVNNPSIHEENDESFIQIGGEGDDESHNWIARVEYPNPDSIKVFLIDAMAIVQIIKKTPSMKKMSDFVFCKRIQRLAKHQEARVVFDEYFDNSLKEKTRAKRAATKKGKGTNRPKVQISYRVSENMSLVRVEGNVGFNEN